ncbi:MAG: hypothetical protein K6G04_07625 [Lachnospiraceae bacterium]|nr:hypothetical protein [Lachnospiraceae bacterium]
MKFQFKHKKVIITLAACAVIALGVTGTYATLTDVAGKVMNHFSGEEINTHIDEDFPPQEVIPGATLDKDVKVANDGPSDAFIRARVTISPEGMAETLGKDANWYYNTTDGWYYYSKVVAVGSKTTSLFTQVKLDGQLKENLDVTVYQEAVGCGHYTAEDEVPMQKIMEAFEKVTTK